MKTRMYFLICLLATTTLTAKAADSFRCRTLSAFAASDTNASDQIEQDLLAGVWTREMDVAGSHDRIQVMLQFAAEGKVDFMQLKAQGDYTTESLRWGVELNNGNPLLWMTGTNGSRRTFRLEQTCYGIELTDTQTAERITFKHNATANTAELSRLRQSLAGTWSNTMYPFDLKASKTDRPLAGAFLQYEFYSNGSFLKTLGGEQVEIQERGTWEVSKDGRYLLMHTVEQTDGRRFVRTEMARIKYLQLDELVLEHALQVNEAKFCTRQKDFFFNKL